MTFTDNKSPRLWFESQIIDVFGTENVECFSSPFGTLYAKKQFAPQTDILFSLSVERGSFIITRNNKHLVVARHDDAATMTQLKATLAALKSGQFDLLQTTECAKDCGKKVEQLVAPKMMNDLR